MLRTLSIKNYALISEISIDFASGLNIITGETGAGKSILIDALSLVLGARASADEVRSGSEKAVVEAVFGVEANKNLRTFSENHEIEWRDEFIVRREISAKGQSRCYVNDSPVPLALQKQVGELLVDLHGQHEHQSLLRIDTHIGMLDEFGGLDGIVEEYSALYESLREKTAALADLRLRERQLLEKKEFYEFQIREIDAVGPHAGEELELERELKILENAERLYSSTGRIYEMLYGGRGRVRISGSSGQRTCQVHPGLQCTCGIQSGTAR